MSHTDPEILALRALGETAGTDRDDEHAVTCARCRAEQARLTGLVALARTSGAPEPLETPPPRVWDQIAAAVAQGGSVAVTPDAKRINGHGNGNPNDAASQDPRPVEAGHGGRSPRGRRRRVAGVLAGVAAGLIIGIGGTAGVVQLTKAPPTRTVAQVELAPLPQYPQWQGSSGTAVMQTSGGSSS